MSIFNNSRFQFMVNTNDPFVTRYRPMLDRYRLPLETLSFDARAEQSDDWAEQMLTRPDLSFDDPFWNNIQSEARTRGYCWDRRPDVYELVNGFFPPELLKPVDAKRESYSLLLLLMELRTEYEHYPEKREYIQAIAKESAKLFLNILYVRQRLDDSLKVVWEIIIFIVCVLLGQWLMSVHPLRMGLVLGIPSLVASYFRNWRTT